VTVSEALRSPIVPERRSPGSVLVAIGNLRPARRERSHRHDLTTLQDSGIVQRIRPRNRSSERRQCASGVTVAHRVRAGLSVFLEMMGA
jgi:hypothetical protein